jgi:hypothetical protein
VSDDWFEEFRSYRSRGRSLPIDALSRKESRLGEAMEGCRRFLVRIRDAEGWEGRYEIAEEIAEGLRCRSRDITLLSCELEAFESSPRFWGVGCYLSALINTSPDSEFLLIPGRVGEKIQEIGHSLDGKRIVIEGDCGSYLGKRMRSGRIVVRGNAKFGTGEGMCGGEIRVEGRIEGVGDVKGGELFQEGRRLNLKAIRSQGGFDRTSFRAYFQDKADEGGP